MSFYKRRRPKPEEEKCADPAKARARALDALASREMSSAQLYERLCYGFTEQAAAAAVAEMVELDYVNDDRYAEARRAADHHWGPVRRLRVAVLEAGGADGGTAH